MCEDCLLYYLAGIIDGEGTIRIAKGKGRKTSTRYRYSVYLCIYNTDLFLLQFIQAKFGGYIRGCAKKNYDKITYCLQWNGRSAQTIIAALKEKLIVKSEQAIIALSLPIADRSIPFGRGHPPLYSEEELIQREGLFQKMKQLNTFGCTIEEVNISNN